ncbi:MAG: DUF4129 domain-containing protein [Candidatus Hydrogenedentes bacterium]|nr:DUF4129 domain-containing protein [Candidatus Hydrogenedentota bacterium]
MSKRSEAIAGGFEIVEEAIYLLRYAPASIHAIYYMGALPFILALLYFWGDMSQSANAQQHLALGSLGLAVLFVWMKCCQSIFASLISARIAQTPPPSWTWKRFVRMAITQTIVQPSGLLLLPMSFVLLLPFPWVYAWYQSMTVLGERTDEGVWESGRHAVGLSKLWPRQNHIVIWLLSPYLVVTAAILMLVMIPVAEEFSPYWTTSLLYFYTVLYMFVTMIFCPMGVLVAANIGFCLFAFPWMLQTFAGIETVIVQGGTFTSPTFYAIVCSLTYLVLDPLVKTAFAIRCFYGESLKTGRDLRAELKLIQQGSLGRAALTVLVVIAASLCATMACAAEAPVEAGLQPGAEVTTRVSAEELDRNIAEVIAQAEYAWRLPREPLEAQKGFLTSFVDMIEEAVRNVFKWVKHQIGRFIDWARGFIPDWNINPSVPTFSWQALPEIMMRCLIVLVVVLLAIFLYRLWRQGAWRRVTVHASPVVTDVPDIANEAVGADALPEDGWVAMARDLLERGELRLAVRAMFLACLAHLARREMILLAKHKSNRDYERELKRRAHAEPDLFDAFSKNTFLFERVWYGNHSVTDEFLRQFTENQQRMTAVAQR